MWACGKDSQAQSINKKDCNNNWVKGIVGMNMLHTNEITTFIWHNLEGSRHLETWKMVQMGNGCDMGSMMEVIELQVYVKYLSDLAQNLRD